MDETFRGFLVYSETRRKKKESQFSFRFPRIFLYIETRVQTILFNLLIRNSSEDHKDSSIFYVAPL